MTYSDQFPGTTHSSVYRPAEPAWVAEIHELRQIWMAVGKAHQDGHPACEMCDHCAVEAAWGDSGLGIESVDTRCLLGTKGNDSPRQCPAIAEAA